jgi:type II secretory pathway pseudopilin PulG
MFGKFLSRKGMSLIELVVGFIISGIVIFFGVSFLSSANRSQARAALDGRSASEMQEFFSQIKKAMSKVQPGGVTSSTAADPRAQLTINRSRRDSTTFAVLADSIEVVQVNCGDPGGILGALPANFQCLGSCPAGQVPVSVSITIDGRPPIIYPNEAAARATPMVFPTGNLGDNLAASLCINLNNNQLSLGLTYLLRYNAGDAVEFRTRTELFTLPVATGGPRPQVIGTVQ